MDLSPRVFLPQEPPEAMEIGKAERFGVLLDPIMPRYFQAATTAFTAIQQLSFHFQTFSDLDYILPLGDPVVIGVSQLLAAHYNDGRYKLLKWNRREETYYSVSVDLKGSLPR